MALLLKQQGIDRVRPLAGGLEEWRRREFPLASGLPASANIGLAQLAGAAVFEAPRGN